MNRSVSNSKKGLHTRTAASRQKEKSRQNTSLCASDAFKTFLLTLFLAAVGTVVASLAAYFTADPDVLTKPLGLAVCALSALIGGWIAGKKNGSAPAVCGTVNGLLLVAAMLLASLFFRENASAYPAWISALLHAGVILLSIAGAILGTRKKPSRAPKRKTRRS